MNDDLSPKSHVLDRLLDHPIPPARISQLVERGEAVTRRRRRVALLGTAVGIVAIAAGGMAVGGALGPSTKGDAESGAAASQPVELECSSGQFSSVTFDFGPPRTKEEARAQGWPTTPEEAARTTLHAPAFAEDLGDLALSLGVPADLPDGAVGVRFTATSPDGSTLAILTVQEVIPGTWATTILDQCR